MKIAAFIDFFIHPNHFTSPNTLRRARLFVRSCFLTSLFSSSYIWMSMIFGYERGVYLMIFNVIGFLLLPLYSKTKLPIVWLGNLYVFIGALAVVILTYYSGGVWSAIYPWIVSIPVLALLVVNRFSGLVWGGISFAVMIWFAMFAFNDVELPVEYNPEMRTLWYISVVPGLLLIVLFIAYVFESIQTNALNEVELKNEILRVQKKTISVQSSALEKLIDEKDYIIRILAHDLKNPLANITSLTLLLGEGDLTKEEQKYIELISQSSSSAQDLINRVLETDESDQNDLKVRLENLDVVLAISEVIQMMNESAKKKDIQIIIDNHSSKNLVMADKTYLGLVFENLISNAIKFSERGKKIQAVFSNDETTMQISIIDEGPGINLEEEDRLFKKFSKLSARPTAGESSTGLGLSLVKRYVELLGGKVWYEGQAGVGATFVVELPLA